MSVRDLSASVNFILTKARHANLRCADYLAGQAAPLLAGEATGGGRRKNPGEWMRVRGRIGHLYQLVKSPPAGMSDPIG